MRWERGSISHPTPTSAVATDREETPVLGMARLIGIPDPRGPPAGCPDYAGSRLAQGAPG